MKLLARSALIGLIAALSVAPAAGAATQRPLHVTWMQGYSAPDTPAKYNRVGVVKIGPAKAKNVLVLEPGTQAGGGYFIPMAQWLLTRVKGWQVWSVERRENLLEDQSVLQQGKQRKVSDQQIYDYYFGFLTNSKITHHFQSVPDSSVQFAKQWGIAVAVEDMHRVIAAAHKLGGKVVLGGHSLGGSLVTGYATWDFGGKPGAAGLSGLVYDDGASLGAPATAAAATQTLQNVQKQSSPWLSAGAPAPYLGLFGAAGALAAYLDPNLASIAQQAGLLKPFGLSPPVPATNLGVFAYDTNVGTSKLVFAFQAHLGRGLASQPVNGVYRWNGTGALTPARRWAAMLAAPDLSGADGLEWYFPNRLASEGLAGDPIDEGNDNPAQHVFGLKDTMGHRLPRGLLMYAFGAYGGKAITAATQTLARQSHIPGKNLTLISKQGTYAHNDPAGAFPKNVFVDHLVQFLKTVSRQH